MVQKDDACPLYSVSNYYKLWLEFLIFSSFFDHSNTISFYFFYLFSRLYYLLKAKRKTQLARLVDSLFMSMLWPLAPFPSFSLQFASVQKKKFTICFVLFVCNDAVFFLLMKLYSQRNTYIELRRLH